VGKLLLFLFTVVPLVELYLLVYLGSVMGFWPTVAIVLGTGMLGAALAKHEGLRVAREWQDAMAEGKMPEQGVIGGLLVLVGGILLVTPGVLTDFFGLTLLLPFTRVLYVRRAKKWFEKRIAEGSVHVHVGGATMGGFGGFARRGPEVIDVEGEEIPVARPQLPDEAS